MVSFELTGLWPLNNPIHPLDWSVQYTKLAIGSWAFLENNHANNEQDQYYIRLNSKVIQLENPCISFEKQLVYNGSQ
jgi:hypothetical protein